MHKILFFIIVAQTIIESLPVSSSGHVTLIRLLAKKLRLSSDFAIPNYIDPILHFSALLAITITFFHDWIFPIKKLLYAFYKMLLGKKLKFSEQQLFKIFFRIIGYILCADLITTFFYFNFKILGKNCVFLQNGLVLLVGFCITTIMLFSLHIKQRFFLKSSKRLNLKKALILGTIQGLASLPGISRLASTYSTAIWLNINNKRALQISFLLHLPLIIASFLFHGIWPVIKHPEFRVIFDKTFFYVFGGSTLLAILSLMLVYKLALKNRLWLFSFYMTIPITLLIICWL